MVRHQAPCPRFDAGGAAIFGQQVAIERVIAVVEEGSRAAIAPLGDVVRMTGNDNTGEAGHEAWCRQRRAVSIKCTVTVISVTVTPAETAMTYLSAALTNLIDNIQLRIEAERKGIS